MNRRFFAEFLTLLSRRVNPDPNVDDDEENEDILKRMQKPIRGTNSWNQFNDGFNRKTRKIWKEKLI